MGNEKKRHTSVGIGVFADGVHRRTSERGVSTCPPVGGGTGKH